MEAVPFESERWLWDEACFTPAEHLGRPCVRAEGSRATLADLETVDGVLELELAVSGERSFPGVFWRRRGDHFESFFVRPHQVGNPDAIQYTPAFNGISSWQLYHGPGYWAPIRFPLDEWFTIRVVFSGGRAEAFVADLDAPALRIGELRLPAEPGRLGIFLGGAPVHLARFAHGGPAEAALREPRPEPPPAATNIVPEWSVSDAFAEAALPHAALDEGFVAARSWTRLPSEASGLVDLARVNGLADGRDTVLARALLRAASAQTKELRLGFSDRAVVYLNGTPLFRGDDTYRSRDYRFLGSIGYHDAVYLPLDEGDNELVIAVSESFGGWGVQARLADVAGVSFA